MLTTWKRARVPTQLLMYVRACAHTHAQESDYEWGSAAMVRAHPDTPADQLQLGMAAMRMRQRLATERARGGAEPSALASWHCVLMMPDARRAASMTNMLRLSGAHVYDWPSE
jgi:hypothetical protein